MVDEPTEVANAFGQHFADMSGRQNYDETFLQRDDMLVTNMPDFGNENTEEYNGKLSDRELTDAINQSGSTFVGPDKMHYEFFKHMNNDQLQELLECCNHIWTHDLFPSAWRHSYIIPILKPGKDCNRIQSYRLQTNSADIVHV